MTFALRLRCGTGDHYMGGTVGLLHNPQREEVEKFSSTALGSVLLKSLCQALVGDEGQLATILDLVSGLSMPLWKIKIMKYDGMSGKDDSCKVVQPDNSVIVFAQTCFCSQCWCTSKMDQKSKTNFPEFFSI